MAQVRFIRVGRNKKTWTADISLDEWSIAREARKALSSVGVDAEYAPGEMRGEIFAGVHRVGEFEVLSASLEVER